MKQYQAKITVRCRECKSEFDETTIPEFTGIEEDEFGRDVVSFKCPNCGEDTDSLRRR